MIFNSRKISNNFLTFSFSSLNLNANFFKIRYNYPNQSPRSSMDRIEVCGTSDGSSILPEGTSNIGAIV